MKRAARTALAWATILLGTLCVFDARAQTVEPPFDSAYTVVDLGPVPGLPAPHGGLVFLAGDPNTLLVGGEANSLNGKLYKIGVVRDINLHITGFTDTATVHSEAEAIDGGLAYGPTGVLFLTRWPNNELGQMMPGSAGTDKVIDLASMGVTESPGGLNFVPHGFPGEGGFKIASWFDGGWYSLELAPDGTGTFDVMSATFETTIPGGPEGFLYIPPGSPEFVDYEQMLVMDWTENTISVYDVDVNGDPIPSTRTLFMTDVSGPEGAAIDPLTGDLLFSFFTINREEILAVRGFAPPPDGDPPLCGDPRPTGPGYWRRQCRAVPVLQGGLNEGQGPKQPTVPAFMTEVMTCADAKLAALGFAETSTCEGIDASPPNDPCERAMRRLTSLILDACSGRVEESCAVDVRPEACSAMSVGDLMREAAALIQAGYCQQAAACAASVADGLGLIDVSRMPKLNNRVDDRPRGESDDNRLQPLDR